MRSAPLAVLLAAAVAHGQEPPPPPPGLVQPTYLQHCFGYPAQVWVDPYPHVYFAGSVSGGGPVDAPVSGGHAAVPAGSGHVGSGGGGDLGHPEALLVLAVVVIAALPVIVYALDEEADPVVRQRFECPAFTFEGGGGTQANVGSGLTAGVFTGKLGFTYANLGLDWRFEGGVGGASVMSSHVTFLANPKQHVEGGLQVGWRGVAWNGYRRDGVEVGLPHRYVFVRDGLRSVGFELEPSLIFGGNALDASLGGHLVVPLAEWAHLRGGARVFSLGAELFYGFDASLALTL